MGFENLIKSYSELEKIYPFTIEDGLKVLYLEGVEHIKTGASFFPPGSRRIVAAADKVYLDGRLVKDRTRRKKRAFMEKPLQGEDRVWDRRVGVDGGVWRVDEDRPDYHLGSANRKVAIRKDAGKGLVRNSGYEIPLELWLNLPFAPESGERTFNWLKANVSDASHKLPAEWASANKTFYRDLEKALLENSDFNFDG